MLPVVNELKSTSDAKYDEKLQAVRAVRDLFTYEGVVKQIDLFIQNVPDTKNNNGEEARRAGVYLRCERVPDKDHRRMSLEGELKSLSLSGSKMRDWFFEV